MNKKNSTNLIKKFFFFFLLKKREFFAENRKKKKYRVRSCVSRGFAAEQKFTYKFKNKQEKKNHGTVEVASPSLRQLLPTPHLSLSLYSSERYFC